MVDKVHSDNGSPIADFRDSGVVEVMARANEAECEHVWQGHDVYGENCINCGLWRGSAYDHAETDPHHGGKIWNETSARSAALEVDTEKAST